MRAVVIVGAAAAFAFGGWAAVAPLSAGSRDVTYVVPEGTAARLQRGETLDVLPTSIRLTLGVQDTLVLRNQDNASHQVGPVLLAPRQTYRINFRVPAHFQYACSLHSTRQLAIIVAPPPPAGLSRLKWRLIGESRLPGTHESV